MWLLRAHERLRFGRAAFAVSSKEPSDISWIPWQEALEAAFPKLR